MNSMNLSCTQCATTNRIPQNRISDHPKCGQCKMPLFLGKPMHLTAANAAATLQRNDIPVVIDCWAPWCGPCRSFAPVFAQAAAELEPRFRFAMLNTEQEQMLAAQWNIRSIPTLLVFKGGREIGRFSGVITLSQLTEWLQQTDDIEVD